MKSTASITCNRPTPIDFHVLKNDLYGHWQDLIDRRKQDARIKHQHINIAKIAYDILVHVTNSWAASFDDCLEDEIEELIGQNRVTGYTVRKLINQHIDQQYS